MLDAITATHAALLQDQLRLQSISQNVSNMQTPGYQRQLAESIGFDNQLQTHLTAVNQQTISQQLLLLTQTGQGNFTHSSQPSDLALSGTGYFTVQTDNGVFYTRRGDFHVNEQGELVTSTGAKLMGKSGSIRVDDNLFTIDASGAISIDRQKVDELSIVQLNPHHLRYQGQGLYLSEEAPKPADSTTRVLQGYLEQATVKSVDEMMMMVKTARHFEAAQRVMQTANSLLSTAINQLGEGHV